MKKRVLSLLLLVALGVCLIGCGSKQQTAQISQEHLKSWKVSVDVPAEKNDAGALVPKYQFTNTKPENAKYKGGRYYLVTDKVIIGLNQERYVFHTGTSYKAAHGNVEPTFELFKEDFMSDKFRKEDAEETTIAGLPAIKKPFIYFEGVRSYTEESKKEDKAGYKYYINIESIDPKANGYVILYIEGGNGNIDEILSEEETKNIINSIKFEKI